MIQKKKQRQYHQGLHKITWHLRNMQQFHRTVGLVSARQKKRDGDIEPASPTQTNLFIPVKAAQTEIAPVPLCAHNIAEKHFFFIWGDFSGLPSSGQKKNVNCRRPLFCCHIATGCCFILPRIYICSRNLWSLSFSSLTFIFYGKRNNNFLPWERTTVFNPKFMPTETSGNNLSDHTGWGS